MDYEKIMTVATSVDKAVQDVVALKSVLLESPVDMPEETSVEPSRSIQEFLDAPLDDKKELAMKKAFAAAMVIAKDKGVLTTVPETAAEIAAVVDDSLTRAKVGYLVETGAILVEEAANTLIDHAESRAVAAVEIAFESGLVREVVTEGIVIISYGIPVIGPSIGPAVEKCKPIIKTVIAKVEKPFKKLITTGIHKLAKAAKSFVKSAAESVKGTVKNIAKSIKSLCS